MSDEIESAMSDAKQKKTAWNEAVTELAEEYSQKLQDIYDQRTAGDFTFLGILGDYTRKLDALRAKMPQTNVKQGVVFSPGINGPFGGPVNPAHPPSMLARIREDRRARNIDSFRY